MLPPARYFEPWPVTDEAGEESRVEYGLDSRNDSAGEDGSDRKARTWAASIKPRYKGRLWGIGQ